MSDSEFPPCVATLTLVDPGGRPLGTLPPLPPTASSWWKDIGPVVDAARERYGIDVTILRLLAAYQPAPPGGSVTYLAEYDGPPLSGLRPAMPTAPHPLRMSWAQPGGPAKSLAWADEVLAGHGRTVTGRQQVRTWNLSSIWRLDTDRGPAWLKEVPPFMAHEGAVLGWLGRPNTPTLLCAAGHRMVLEDIPGTDRYDAPSPERQEMLADLLEIQADSVDRLPELIELGVPREGAAGFRHDAETMLPQWIDGLPREDRAVLDDLVGGLAERFAALADCGIPDTLMHADFHPGNVRADGTHRVLIDWGDSRIGHPAVDLIRMRDCPGSDQEALCEQWCAYWRRAVPGSEPERAVELIDPVVALRGALIYGMFLRSIEPSERPYHDLDVPNGVRTAIELHRMSQPA
ncbi:MAG TPA: aminoglycoside phosphotransferase family protein [Pseudonocardiaceae bacterium]